MERWRMMDGFGSRGERYMKIASSDNKQKNSCNSIPKWSRGGIRQCPKCTPKSNRTHSNGSRNTTEMRKGGARRACKNHVTKKTLRCRKVSRQVSNLGTIFGSNFEKIPSKKTWKKQAPRNMTIYAKRLPTWRQNRCQNSSKNNTKACTETDGENHQKSCFSEG